MQPSTFNIVRILNGRCVEIVTGFESVLAAAEQVVENNSIIEERGLGYWQVDV